MKNDDPNAKYGNRFNRHLLPLYVLIGMSGEYTMSLLHQYFGFPSSRTIRNFRNALKLKYEIDDQIFDGSIKSIKKFVKLFKDTSDNRCFIAVDFAAVNAKITIHKDGEVEGLMNKLTIDQKTMDLITSKSIEFHKFYISHRNEIVKYFFCILCLIPR